MNLLLFMKMSLFKLLFFFIAVTAISSSGSAQVLTCENLLLPSFNHATSTEKSDFYKLEFSSKNLRMGDAVRLIDSYGGEYEGLYVGASKRTVFVIDPDNQSMMEINRDKLDESGFAPQEPLFAEVQKQCRGDCLTKAFINVIARWDLINGRHRLITKESENAIYRKMPTSPGYFASYIKDVLKKIGITAKPTVSLSKLIAHLKSGRPAIIATPVKVSMQPRAVIDQQNYLSEGDEPHHAPVDWKSPESDGGHAVAALGAIVTKADIWGRPQKGYVIIADTGYGHIAFYKIEDLSKVAAGYGDGYILIGK